MGGRQRNGEESAFSTILRRRSRALVELSPQARRRRERESKKGGKGRRNSPPRTAPRAQRLPLDGTGAPSSSSSSSTTLLLLHPSYQTPSSSSKTASYGSSNGRLAPSAATLPRWDRHRSRRRLSIRCWREGRSDWDGRKAESKETCIQRSPTSTRVSKKMMDESTFLFR